MGWRFLGIELDEKRNAANEGVISLATGRVAVRVIHTDEEWMIASSVCRVLGLAIENNPHFPNDVIASGAGFAPGP